MSSRQIADLYPLSPVQEGMLFHTLLMPGEGMYFDQVLFDLAAREELDPGAFRAAWQAMVDHHPVLRTAFVWKTRDTAQQAVLKKLELPWQELDWTDLPPTERDERLSAWLAADRKRGFELSRAPLIRCTLIRLGTAEHCFVLSYHHILMDAWSLALVVRNFLDAYQRLSRGESPKPPERRPYRDYVRWLGEQDSARAESYWRRLLTGIDEPTPFAIDRPARDRAATPYGSVADGLPAAATDALRELGRRHGLTLNTLVQGAWALVLAAYSGRRDVLFGVTVSGRPPALAGVEAMVGLFINTLPLRARLAADATLVDLLRGLQQELVEMRDFEHSPLVAVHGWSEVPRDRPLFESIVVFENVPIDGGGSDASSSGGGSLQVRPAQYNPRTNYPLTLIAIPGPRLVLRLLYETARFDTATVRRMGAHLQSVLERMPTAADQRLGELLPWTPAERHQSLLEWNDTHVPRPRGETLHGRFTAMAESAGSRVAVADGTEELTYRELDRRSDQLANHLRELGCGREGNVALAVDRSVRMVMGLLGILKAGAAYVPIDPSYPPVRVEHMLDDSGARVLVTEEAFAQALGGETKIVLLDSDALADTADRPNAVMASEQLAYVIYTSGSTGRPKGVQISHRALLNFLDAMARRPGFGAEDILLAVTTLSFDIAGLELFLPLLAGGRVAIADRRTATNGERLAVALRDTGATVMQATPATWRLLLEAGWQGDGELRALCGGEALPSELARHLLPCCGSLWNLYGPTETTVWSAVQRVEDGDGSVAIGRPIDNTSCYLLDGTFRPVMPGVPGELAIGGDGLARGYRGQPRQSAERFVPDPHGGVLGGRLYKTGDLIRHAADGRMKFLGRADHQVKVRGFRIELGEIEAALEAQESVRQAVVMARKEADCEAALLAWILPETEAAPSSEARDTRLAEWRDVWGEAYTGGRGEDPTFNLAGWKSSYTGEPVPAVEMKEWVDATVERILALRPRKVLEIGSGTGLLLFRIGPHCERYWGCDFSAEALAALERGLPLDGDTDVRLFHRPADDLPDLEPGSFDTIVLNSVVQYFPDVDYLLRVLAAAAELLAPGGTIFLGDLRSLPLLEAFHASVVLARAAPETSREEVARRLRDAAVRERELVIDPGLFRVLSRRLPRLAGVRTELKRGRHHNELTRFRYDVTLHFDTGFEVPGAERWVDWRERGMTPGSLRRFLVEAEPAVIGFRDVPDARLTQAMRAVNLLADGDGPENVEALRGALTGSGTEAVDPEELYSFGQELPYEVEIHSASTAADGFYDVLFLHREKAAAARGAAFRETAVEAGNGNDSSSPILWGAYTNHPVRTRVGRDLAGELGAALRQELPEHMVPTTFVPLTAFPLTPNGKVDRLALERLEQRRRQPEGDSRGGRTPVEDLLAGIFAEVLERPAVGADESFFELGGHSLLATRVVARVRKSFGVELPVVKIFERPTAARLALEIEAALKKDEGRAAPALEPIDRDKPLVLSFAQERLWAVDQLRPGEATYNLPAQLRLAGPLHVAALAAAVNEVRRRHEVLRTTFVEDGGQPVQMIAAYQPKPLPLVDLTRLSAPQREAVASGLARREARAPFDLARGPLLRFVLLRADEQEHIAVLTMHHIVSDDWSMTILARELSLFYAAFANGQEPDLEMPRVQYADYAHWQRQWLAGEALAGRLAYWKQVLGDPGDLPELPTDRPREPRKAPRGGQQSFALAAEVGEALRSLGQRRGATLYMTLLALYQVVLAWWSKRDEAVVGTSFAERPRPEVEGLIGFFVNTLVLRTDLAGDPTFNDLLERVREVCLGAYLHAELPFEKLVKELQPERTARHIPLFQAFFVLHTAAGARFEAAELTMTPLGEKSGAARYDLMLSLAESSGRVVGALYYDAHLYYASTASRLAGHLKTLAECLAAAPDLRLSELREILDAADREQRLSQRSAYQEARRERLKSARSIRRAHQEVSR